jgi:sulfate transport system ATP-binding protein
MEIRIHDVHKYYEGYHALRGVNLDIASGELLALLGPSGSGKTTLLRSIAGLEPLDAGQIHFGDIDATQLSVQERRVGFVFQQYALFKHMTIADNIAFGLRIRDRKSRPDNAHIAKRVADLLELVQLKGLAQRFPSQLSGGQKQRVALARALAIEPRVLLLDEPFGALDAKVRKELRRWLRALHRETGYTTIFVTHDQEEALELADRVVVMNEGRFEQVGTTDEVFDKPSSPFVFDFLGTPNILPAQVSGGQLQLEGATQPLSIAVEQRGQASVDLYARPADFQLVDQEDPSALDGSIVEAQRTGSLIRLTLGLHHNGQLIEIELPHRESDQGRWQGGRPIRVRPYRFSVFPRSGVNQPKPPTEPVEEALVAHRPDRSRG